jgi:hypothetical protein
MPVMTSPFALEEDYHRLLETRHHDPFSILGRHELGKETVVRAYLPHTLEAFILEGNHHDLHRPPRARAIALAAGVRDLHLCNVCLFDRQ